MLMCVVPGSMNSSSFGTAAAGNGGDLEVDVQKLSASQMAMLEEEDMIMEEAAQQQEEGGRCVPKASECHLLGLAKLKGAQAWLAERLQVTYNDQKSSVYRRAIHAWKVLTISSCRWAKYNTSRADG